MSTRMSLLREIKSSAMLCGMRGLAPIRRLPRLRWHTRVITIRPEMLRNLVSFVYPPGICRVMAA